MKWNRVEREFEYYKALFGMNNMDVRIVRPKDFKDITGFALGSAHGKADRKKRVITVKRNRTFLQIRKTIVHELAHLLFPTKPHWWIECFAYRIIPVKNKYGEVGRYTERYDHSPRDIPSKKKCIELAKKAAKRLKL